MLPLLVGGALLLIAGAFSDEEKEVKRKPKNKKKKIFISFPFEDRKYRDFLVAQGKNGNSPFEFVDMSLKKALNQKIWKQKCREKIQGCDGMIVLLSNNSWHSSGSRWEIKCAIEEDVPVIGMHIRKEQMMAIPPELRGKKIITWSWNNLEKSINKF